MLLNLVTEQLHWARVLPNYSANVPSGTLPLTTASYHM